MRKLGSMVRMGVAFGLVLVITLSTFEGKSYAAASEKVNWLWNFYPANKEEEPLAKAYAEQVIPRVKQRTNGNFNIRALWGSEIGITATNYPPALARGAIQMAWTYPGYYTGDMPLLQLMGIPMLTRTIGEYKILSNITRKHYAKAYRDTYENKLELVAVSPYNWQALVTTKILVSKTNFAGMKIRVADKVMMDWVTQLGGIGTFTTWAEMVPALHQGVVTGVITGFDALTATKVYEICKYVYLLDCASAESHVIATSKALAALPKDYRDILLEELARTDEYNWKTLMPVNADHDNAIAKWRQEGATIFELTAAERAELEKKSKPTWAKIEKSLGTVATEVLTEYFSKVKR